MFKFRAALIAGLTALLSACSPFAAINLLVPRGGYSVHSAIAYGRRPAPEARYLCPG